MFLSTPCAPHLWAFAQTHFSRMSPRFHLLSPRQRPAPSLRSLCDPPRLGGPDLGLLFPEVGTGASDLLNIIQLSWSQDLSQAGWAPNKTLWSQHGGGGGVGWGMGLRDSGNGLWMGLVVGLSGDQRGGRVGVTVCMCVGAVLLRGARGGHVQHSPLRLSSLWNGQREVAVVTEARFLARGGSCPS